MIILLKSHCHTNIQEKNKYTAYFVLFCFSCLAFKLANLFNSSILFNCQKLTSHPLNVLSFLNSPSLTSAWSCGIVCQYVSMSVCQYVRLMWIPPCRMNHQSIVGVHFDFSKWCNTWTQACNLITEQNQHCIKNSVWWEQCKWKGWRYGYEKFGKGK